MRMTPENFCYWLQGYFELLNAGPKTPEKLTLTVEQVEMVNQHLQLVFKKEVFVGMDTSKHLEDSMAYTFGRMKDSEVKLC